MDREDIQDCIYFFMMAWRDHIEERDREEENERRKNETFGLEVVN